MVGRYERFDLECWEILLQNVEILIQLCDQIFQQVVLNLFSRNIPIQKLKDDDNDANSNESHIVDRDLAEKY